jgi:hypothetical protein
MRHVHLDLLASGNSSPPSRPLIFLFPCYTPANNISTKKHQDNTVASKEHFANEAVLVDSSPASLGFLRPHFLDVFEHHIAVAIEGFDPRKQLAIIAA